MNGGPTPPNENTGTSRDAVAIRQLIRYCKSLEVKSVVGGKVSRGPDGTKIEVGTSFGGGTPATPSTLQRVWFDSMRENYMVCVNAPFTATTPTQADMMLVAKPEELRNSVTAAVIDGLLYNYTYPFNPSPGGIPTLDGAFIRRTATATSVNSSILLKEVIVPRYLKYVSGPTTFRTPLYVMTVGNGTGVVSIGTNDGTGIPVNTAITLLDINVGARAWSKKRDQTT